jgi:hypothetical protein
MLNLSGLTWLGFFSVTPRPTSPFVGHSDQLFDDRCRAPHKAVSLEAGDQVRRDDADEGHAPHLPTTRAERALRFIFA